MTAGCSSSGNAPSDASIPDDGVPSEGAAGEDTTSRALDSGTGDASDSALLPQDDASAFYGPGIAADSLDNHQVADVDVDIRFRAAASGAVASLRWYDIYTPKCAPHSGVDAGTCPADCPKSGVTYACGTGGDMHICVQTDDGTAAHLTTGVDLGCVDHPHASGPPFFPLEKFPAPPQLTKGQLYHLHWHNTDPSPTVNFTSVDGLYVEQATTPRQPSVSDLDLALFRGSTPRPQDTPIFQLTYVDGTVQGQGYMEVWSGAPRTISGGAKVREQFKVSGGDRVVRSLGVRVSRTAGTSPLVVRLETLAGALVEEGNIPSGAFPVGPATAAVWGVLPFASSHVLANGQEYTLVLSAASDASYEAFAVERGAAYGFTTPSFFGDGYGQYTTTDGGTWTGFDQPGGASDSHIADVQVYFE